MPHRLIALLLQDWREAERELATLPGDAPAEVRAAAQGRVASTRTGYQEAHRALQELYRLDGASDAQPATPYAYTGMVPRGRAACQEAMVEPEGSDRGGMVDVPGEPLPR
jgi:hypothetical protein